MIDIRQLRKEFGQFVAVDNVSFSVKKGEVLGFLGPNGAGKSTTMKMITGFLQPTSGTAIVNGHDVTKEPTKVKASLGYLPEGAPAYPDMTPLAFLKFVGEIRGLRGAAGRKRIDQVVDMVSLRSHLHQPIETLSKGFKRRVGLAQAILHDPGVLIMDEPTDGLDPNQKHEVRQLIQSMAGTKAIVLSTHILEEVEAVCTRAIIIAAGKVIADGTPQELIERGEKNGTIHLQLAKEGAGDAEQKLHRLSGVKKVVPVAGDNGSVAYQIIPDGNKDLSRVVADAARSNNWQVMELRREKARLDDVFRSLTAKTTADAGREN